MLPLEEKPSLGMSMDILLSAPSRFVTKRPGRPDLFYSQPLAPVRSFFLSFSPDNIDAPFSRCSPGIILGPQGFRVPDPLFPHSRLSLPELRDGRLLTFAYDRVVPFFSS